MSSRSFQKQIWADMNFVKKLEEIKAKRTLIGIPVKNIGELTKEIINTESFAKLEDELIRKDKNIRINIKMEEFFR